MATLTVIIGSTRPGRAGLPIAEWFVSRAREHGGFKVEVADLAEVRLPLFDEPDHPGLRRYTKQHTREWSQRIDRADAIVIVTAEYNHGYPASVKNALDYLHQEWQDKPVAFVSYGGVSAGTRAVQQLKQVVTALKMVPVAESVNIPFHTQFIGGDGRLQANETMERAADAMLDELLSFSEVLKPRREERRLAA
jgi:NAD(P)H-dependent FMN reductase